MMVLTFFHEGIGQVAQVVVYNGSVVFTTEQDGELKGGLLEKHVSLSVSGILKDHPDLDGKPVDFIRSEGVRRFKKKLFSFPSWEARKNYLKNDLAKHGYKLVRQALPGQRERRVG